MAQYDEVCSDFIATNSIDEVEAFIDTVDPIKFDTFVSGLVVHIHKIIKSIESKADTYYNYSEEALSANISSALEGYGYHVVNEAKNRGKMIRKGEDLPMWRNEVPGGKCKLIHIKTY